MEHYFLTKAAPLLTFELLMKQSIHENERLHHRDFLFDLLYNNFDSLEVISSRGKLWGWDFSKPHLVAVGEIQNFTPLPAERQRLSTLIAKVSRNPGAICLERNDQVVLLFPLEEMLAQSLTTTTAEQLLQPFWKVADTIFPGRKFFFGLGNLYPTAREIHRSFQEARSALEIGRLLYPDKLLTSFSELGIMRLLQRLEHQELEDFRQETLKPLLDFDRDGNVELEQTLLTYYLCNGDHNLAAQKLFMKISRRQFIGATAATAAGASLFSFQMLTKLNPAAAADSTAQVQEFRNVCPRNCYDTCAQISFVQNGILKKVEGDPKQGYTNGKLCLKGYTYTRRVYSPDRVKYPMKQTPRGSGNWTRISWDEAMNTIAKKILDLKKRYGSTLPICFDKYSGNFGILHYGADGTMSSIGYTTRALGTPCWPAGIDAQTYDFGTLYSNDPEDMVNANYIILWGVNDLSLTTSAEAADIFLPATTHYEHWDLNSSYWHYWVGINEPAIPPVGEARSDLEIAWNVSAKLNELEPGSCAFPTHGSEKETMLKQLSPALLQLLGLTKPEEILAQPVKANLSPTAWVERKFATPSGRFEFFSTSAAAVGFPALPSYIPAQIPRDAPLRLLTPHHSAMINSQSYQDIAPDCYKLQLNPELARDYGLKKGDLAELFNESGSLQVRLLLDPMIPTDVVIIYQGTLKEKAPCLNVLLKSNLTDMGSETTGAPGFAINETFVNLRRLTSP